jgi:hypothetical protein
MSQSFNSICDFLRGTKGAGYIQVRALADLPTPVESKITLEASKVYIFDGLINIGTNQIVCAENSSLIGFAPATNGIIYTGTGFAIECNDETLYMRYMAVVCVSGGSGLEFKNTTQDEFLNVNGCAFIGCDCGVCVDGVAVAAFGSVLFRDCKTGITKGNTNSGRKILVDTCFFDSTPNHNDGIAIKIEDTATLKDLDLLSCKFQSNTTGTFIKVDDPGTVTNTGTLFNNRFDSATATFIDGVNFSTENWDLLNNDGIENSRINGQYFFTGNTTATTITTQNVWVKLTTATTASLLSGFSHTSPNTLTYLRRRDRVILIVLSGAVSSTAGNTGVEIGIFVDGELAASTPLDVRFANELEPFSASLQVQAERDEDIDIRIRNTTGTQNLIVGNARLSAVVVS